ncbi:MAG: hypothetical protein JST37_10490 [Bacteroidetes bacterium]|nr:hypothetical protein [Bacteroidota bacterium]
MIDLFQNLPNSKELHPKFLQLRDSKSMIGERHIIANWTEGFIDRDNKLVREFQVSFHSTFWELYLHHLLYEQGFTTDYSHNRPDFAVVKPYRFFIEAVISNIKYDGRPESTRNQFDILKNLTPPHLQPDFEYQMIEAIIRYSNAINNKVSKHQLEYSGLPWVDERVPFVIALGSYSQVNFGKEYYYPMLALLYGLFYDPLKRDYLPRDFVFKPGTSSPINLGLFEDPKMQNISAVIFSCTVTLGKLTSLSKSAGYSSMNTVLLIREEAKAPHFHFQEVSINDPEQHSDGLFVFHNPNAKVKLPVEVFSDSCALQVSSNGDDYLQFSGSKAPLFSRLSLPSILLPFEFKKSLIEETYKMFNS